MSPEDQNLIRFENGFQVTISDKEIERIASNTSRENLDIGCMLIKKKVIEKALKKVREDPTIT